MDLDVPGFRQPVAHVDVDVDHGRAVGPQPSRDPRGDEVDVGQAAHRHRPVDPPEVEPRAMPGLGLHLQRIAVVGADHERVRALRGAEALLERLIDAGVPAERAPVEPDEGAVVDRLEIERVAPVGREVQARPVPGEIAVVAHHARRAGHATRVRDVGHPNSRAREPPARPAVEATLLRGVVAHHPRSADRGVPGRRGARRGPAHAEEGAGKDGDGDQRDERRDEAVRRGHRRRAQSSGRTRSHPAVQPRDRPENALRASSRRTSSRGIPRCPRGRPRGRSPTA